MIAASKDAQEVILLDWLPCIHYQVQFQKDQEPTIWALIDLGSEINTMTLAYAKQLGLWTRKTSIRASLFRTFKIVIVGFQIEDKLDRVWFFQESFLLANTRMEIVLGMVFVTFSNANIQFREKELTWRFYITAEALPTTKQVELINKKEFAKTVLDEGFETFVVHVAALEAPLAGITIHHSREARISALI